MTFTKIERGWYATADGRYAVISENALSADENSTDFVTATEWALCSDPNGDLRHSRHAGENVDWFDTKREAVEAANRMETR